MNESVFLLGGVAFWLVTGKLMWVVTGVLAWVAFAGMKKVKQ